MSQPSMSINSTGAVQTQQTQLQLATKRGKNFSYYRQIPVSLKLLTQIPYIPQTNPWVSAFSYIY